MEFTHLTPLEVKDLINKYRSDLRKLEYQTLKTKGIINELERYASNAEEALSLEEANVQELPAAPAEQASADVSEQESAAPAEAKPETAEAAKPKRATKPKGKAAPKSTDKKPAKKKPGRPKGSTNKSKSTTPANKAAGSKDKEPSGYRLSDWDQFVINKLEEKSSALTTSDFADLAKEDPSIKSGEAQIKIKLNRSLHKLANKKGLLSKVEYSGRGFAYAKAEWLNSKGNLPKKYAHKG